MQHMKSSFDHPERKPTECWLFNHSRSHVYDFIKHNVLKTLRVGKIGYDIYGREVPGIVPVFIDRNERGRSK
jgi:hypothetical protein